MRNIKRGLLLILTLAIAITGIVIPTPKSNAATKKIKIYDFIRLVVEATGEEVDTSKNSPYLTKAKEIGIVKDGDFSNYKGYLTRTDAAVIINRADEYLNGDKLDSDLLNIVLKGRISDIKKIDKDKRQSVGKAYAKGYMVGFSNGYYIKNRQFKGSDYITATEAKKIVTMLKDKSKRYKLSPDGQVIRTTNLPKNAKDYEYILETYPNSFYEMKFEFQRETFYFEPKELVDYARPAKFKKISDDMDEILEKYLDTWVNTIETNLKTRLNINYKTIDNTWINTLRSTYTQFKDAKLDKRKTDAIKAYVNFIKKNKIVIKSKTITVEPSTLYMNDTGYIMRVYVKFKVDYSGSNLTAKDLLFGSHIWMPNLKKGKWFEGVYDIRLGTINGNSDGEDYYVVDDSLQDYDD